MNSHSESVAAKLFDRFPQWRQHAQSLPSRFGDYEYLLVEVPAPAGSRAGALQIWTDNEDVQVAFKGWRASMLVDEYGRDELTDFVTKLITDQCAFAVCAAGEKWHWTEFIEVAERPVPEPESTVQVVSWTGAADCDYDSESL